MKVWFVEHRNLKIFFLKSNHESDNSIKESKNQLKCLKDVKRLLIQVIFTYGEDILFKHKIKSNKGCLVDALAIRGDEGRERLR